LERVRGQAKIGVACDLLLAWRTIADGVTAQSAKARKKYWKHWTTYCTSCNTDPYLTDLTTCEKTVIITAFAGRVRTRAYGLGNQVGVQTVTQALSVITKTCQLVGQPSPVIEKEGEYIVPVKQVVEGFRCLDPPSIPQMAVPVEVPQMA
jgi:hypothetical protein